MYTVEIIPELAARAGSVSAIFAVAYACLALSGAPYNLAVATHHTRYAAIFNAAAVVWYPLLGYWLIRHFGLTGAALLWLSYCSMATLACTLVAWFIVDRAYCAGWEMARLLAVPVLATALGALARTLPVVAVQPLLSRTAYAAIGSLVILAVGLFVVLGRAGIARLAEGRFERRASASIPPMP